MRITAEGNVGIGTTSPSAKLHIEGDGGNSASLQIKSTIFIWSWSYVFTTKHRWKKLCLKSK